MDKVEPTTQTGQSFYQSHYALDMPDFGPDTERIRDMIGRCKGPMMDLYLLSGKRLRKNLNESIELHRQILLLVLSRSDRWKDLTAQSEPGNWALQATVGILKQFITLRFCEEELYRAQFSLATEDLYGWQTFMLSRINYISAQWHLLSFSDLVLDRMHYLLCYVSAAARTEEPIVLQQTAMGDENLAKGWGVDLSGTNLLDGIDGNPALAKVAKSTYNFIQECYSVCVKPKNQSCITTKEFRVIERQTYTLLRNLLCEFQAAPIKGYPLEFCEGKCRVQNCQNTSENSNNEHKFIIDDAFELMVKLRKEVCREMPPSVITQIDMHEKARKAYGTCVNGGRLNYGEAFNGETATNNSKICKSCSHCPDQDIRSEALFNIPPPSPIVEDETSPKLIATAVESTCENCEKEENKLGILAKIDSCLQPEATDDDVEVEELSVVFNERVAFQIFDTPSFTAEARRARRANSNEPWKTQSNTWDGGRRFKQKTQEDIRDKYERRNLGKSSMSEDELNTKQGHDKIAERVWLIPNARHFHDVWRVIFPKEGDAARTRGFKFSQFISAMTAPPFNCRVKDDLLGVKINFARRTEDGGEETFNVHMPHGRDGWCPLNYMWYYRKNLRRAFGIDGTNIFLVDAGKE